MPSFADAVYVLSLILLVLAALSLQDAVRRVDWAAWWASTRTSEGGRESGPCLPSGARSLSPPPNDGPGAHFSEDA